MDEQESYLRRKQENLELDNEHDYPFPGSVHLDPVSINKDAVQFSYKTRYDFDKPDKLKLQATPKSRSGYEAYYRSCDNRMRTRGLFQNDAGRINSVKHPGDMQVQNQRDLYRINPTIKEYYDKILAVDNKKLQVAKQSRFLLNEDTKKVMEKQEARFLRSNKRSVREQWQSPQRPQTLRL